MRGPLIRHCKGVLELHPTHQKWAGEVITVLREAAAAVTDATTGQLDPQLLTDLRARYDHAVTWGVTTNRHRDWHNGNHPGYTLAKRLHDKAEQVWTFTRNLAVPWTNNASEQALKAPKRHQAVSGYWHTLNHPRRLLPRPLLPPQRPQPRHPPHRRHPRRPHRQPLAPHHLNGVKSQPNP
jgi:hypothetical protein